jgi:hypothetical protein
MVGSRGVYGGGKRFAAGWAGVDATGVEAAGDESAEAGCANSLLCSLTACSREAVYEGCREFW